MFPWGTVTGLPSLSWELKWIDHMSSDSQPIPCLPLSSVVFSAHKEDTNDEAFNNQAKRLFFSLPFTKPNLIIYILQAVFSNKRKSAG